MTVYVPILALGVLLAGGASAATRVAVTAGEHGDHSRIVLPAGANIVAVTEETYAIGLHFEGATEFDLTDLNRRRKARRVLKAAASPSANGAIVTVDLACDCRIDQQSLPDGRTIIDIYDPPPAPTLTQLAPKKAVYSDPSVDEAGPVAATLFYDAARREDRAPYTPPAVADAGLFVEPRAATPAPAPTPAAAPTAIALAQPSAAAAPPVDQPRAVAPDTDGAAESVSPAPVSIAPPQLKPDVLADAGAPRTAAPAAGAQPAGAAPTGADQISVEDARQRMIELLQKAANDGLVTVKKDAPELTAPVPLRPAPAAADGTPAPSPTPAATAPAVFACLPDSAFAIDGAAFDEDPLGAVSALQSDLAGAAPGEEAAKADALAGGYLAIGFGEEALAALSEYGLANSLRADMARIVADKTLPKASIIAGARDCRGGHALWQAAGASGETAAAAAARSGDAAEKLPKRLRAILSVRIARNMLDAEAFDEARRFYRLANEATGAPTPDLQFIAAKLLEHDGGGAESEKMLSDIASTNTETAKEALLALAERYAATGDRPESFVDDIGALAKTEKGSARGAEAAFREALIWAEEGNVEAAIMLLKNSAESNPAVAELAAAKAREVLGATFASDDQDKRVAALSAYMEHRSFVDLGAAAGEAAKAAADAAMALGLPNVAIDLSPGGATDHAAIMSRAKALLAAGDAERALEAAAPYADAPAFAALIIDANLALQRNHAALAAATAISDPQEKAARSAEAAWRAGEWASAARAYHRIDPSRLTVETARRFGFAAYMAGEPGLPAAAEAVLRAAGDAALEGLLSLFAGAAPGTIVERGKAATKGADEELKLIEEVLSHG